MDVGVVEQVSTDGSTIEQCFVVMAGIGVDADMASNADDTAKGRVGWIAYAKPISESMRGGSRVKLRYQLDDEKPRSLRLHTLIVGNCGSLPGKVRLLPAARVDDGLLDLVALRPSGPFGWLQIAWTLVVENAILHRAGRSRWVTGIARRLRPLRYLQARRIEVKLDEPQDLEIDGDPAGVVTAFTVRVEHHALRVRVPGADRGQM